MGVDARMLVQLVAPIADEALTQANYRLAEAVRGQTFWLSRDKDIANGEQRRALNRVNSADHLWDEGGGIAQTDGCWLFVSLLGRYYGPTYERGDIWRFIAIAEWLEHNFLGCRVFYGGDSGETLDLFNAGARRQMIAHWAEHGQRPYYAAMGWHGAEKPDPPMCPLCQHPATRYGTGKDFASWTCDACQRLWVWVGKDVRAFDVAADFDVFAAAKTMRTESTDGPT